VKNRRRIQMRWQ